MTYLEVIYTDRQHILRSKTFSLDQIRKAVKLFLCKRDSLIVLRETKLGYEPSFSESGLNANTYYWTENIWLREFAEFLRSHKDIINWDNRPIKTTYIIWYELVNDKGFPIEGHYVYDNEGNIKQFDSKRQAAEYCRRYIYQKGIEPTIITTITW